MPIAEETAAADERPTVERFNALMQEFTSAGKLTAEDIARIKKFLMVENSKAIAGVVGATAEVIGKRVRGS